MKNSGMTGEMMAAAMMAAALAPTGAGFADTTRTIRASTDQTNQTQLQTQKGSIDRNTRRVLLGGGAAFGGSYFRRAGPGWTNAHQKRVALKARNVKRHRAARRAAAS